jgi:hypothetical protein
MFLTSERGGVASEPNGRFAVGPGLKAIGVGGVCTLWFAMSRNRF